MSRFTQALLIFLIVLTTFAQPGICPCWLMLDVRHPHPDGHPEQKHPHDYLDDLFSAGTPAVATLLLVTAHTLIAVLALGKLWQSIAITLQSVSSWALMLEPPPPRGIASCPPFCAV